jgi:PBP1b-binding outer membrane lipoprotein LpoB
MRKKTIILLGFLLISILLTGCSQEPQKPEGALSVAELLENPIYDTQTRVYGKVSALGELMCTCFFLGSEEGNLHVWYDTMVDNDGTLRPSISIEEINNGDWVIVIGELKSGGDHYSLNDFWLSDIEVIR